MTSHRCGVRAAAGSHTSAIPDLGQGLRCLHLLPQRSLHLVSQHLTQAVFGVGGGVFVPDCLLEQETTESVEHLMLHGNPKSLSVPLIDAHVFEVVLHHSLQRKRPPLTEHRGIPHGSSRQHDRRGAGHLPEDLDVIVGLHQIQRAPTAGQVWMQTFTRKITAALQSLQ